MALVKKMKEGDKTPTLYTHYGKQYDFDEFLRNADAGFNEFLGTLKRGQKDQDKFREAYSNIMSGIKDGTITFKDGRYYDSLGRYTNSEDKNKNKDYYGLVANYIYNKQGESKEYVKPEDKTKIKWSGNTGIGTAFNRFVYGSDSGNILDFIDLDQYDKDAKSRGVANRSQKTYDALNHIYNNFDSLFTGFSDEDKILSRNNLEAAMTAIKDGSIDAGDYLALNKAVGGLNFRNMFLTQEAQLLEATLQQGNQPASDTDKFLEWVLQKYPIFTGTLHNPIGISSSRTYDENVWNNLSKAFNNISDNDLFTSLRTSIQDDNYDMYNELYIRDIFEDADPGFTRGFAQQALLNALKNRNLLHSFGGENVNLYYIPNTEGEGRQTAWVWDSQNNKLSEMSYHDIPYWRDKIRQEWLGQNGGYPRNYYGVRYGFHKEGGILKAQFGLVMKRGEKDNWLSIDNSYQNARDINTWDTYYNNAGIDADIISGNPWQKGYLKDDKGVIIKGDDGEVKYGLSAGQVGNLLNQLNATGSNLAWDKELNGKGYDQWNRLFDQTGLNTYFGGDSNKFDYMGPSTYNRHALLQRMLQTHGKDNPLKIGNGSIYWDGKQWNIPVSEAPKIDPIIAKSKQPTALPDKLPLPKPTGSNVDLVSIGQKLPKDYTNLGLAALGFIPEIIGAGRLFDSLRTNNRVAKTIRESLNAPIKDTYELYSPITGAFSEMQFRNNQAADLRRLGSRPVTSDASLALAANLDANKLATQLEHLGFLADDKEINRTQAEALRRLEDNISRRSAVANENRFSINRTNRERAELEATRLRRNWQSRDNYLLGVEGRLRNKFETDKERRNNFRLQTSIADIDQQYQEAVSAATNNILKSATERGVSISSLPEYTNYENFIREMLKWKNARTYGTHARVYGYLYNNDYLDRTVESIKGKYSYLKNGGQLRPSITYLINKVIKDESNT